MAIIDCFHYNGEREVLKIHLTILAPYVDKFIICEAKTTFSGYKKPLYFFRQQRYFREFWNKIEYHVIHEEWTEEEIQLAENSPNTRGAAHWKHEFLQKEAIQKALIENKVEGNDLLFIGDVDEIIDPTTTLYSDSPIKAKLRVYAYYLNNLSSEEFWGTLITEYKDIKGKCLNHMRSDTKYRSKETLGWHFTSMGGLKEVQRKLNDSYTTESYNTADVQMNLRERHRRGLDYLGRPFTFSTDESYWPKYLLDNKKEFKHLCIPESPNLN